MFHEEPESLYALPISILRQPIPRMGKSVAIHVWAIRVYDRAEPFRELPDLIYGTPVSGDELPESICWGSMLIFGLMEACQQGQLGHEAWFCLGDCPGVVSR